MKLECPSAKQKKDPDESAPDAPAMGLDPRKLENDLGQFIA